MGLSASAGTLVLEGNYQGKNLFIQNPFSEAGVGFCVYEVTVNDQIATDEINSSAFEVDMSNFGLKLGDKVSVKIKHKDGCTPLVLNPEVLKPKSTFDIVKQQVAADGTYSWVTSNETGELPFLVEQKRCATKSNQRATRFVALSSVPVSANTRRRGRPLRTVPFSQLCFTLGRSP